MSLKSPRIHSYSLCSFRNVVDDEVGPVVADLAPEGHPAGERAVDHLRLDGSAGIERAPVPFGHAARRDLDAAAERPLVGAVLAGDHVEVVGLECFAELEVDLALVLGHELLPSAPCGRWATSPSWS